jgi:DHA1 family bicyclomycin/chloramphenicol resistance-like MFS transporter
MRTQIDSVAFTVPLALLAALPSFGIDMVLPALTTTSAGLGVSVSEAGLTMSAFLLSLGAAPLIYGPASDRYGRKPIVVLGCTLLIIASIGCALAQSLPALLAWRVVQGVGAASTTMTAIAIIRDLFGGHAARARMSHLVTAINIVPIVAPTAGAALLPLGGWRLIYAAYGAVSLILLLVIWFGFNESARIDPANRPVPSVVVRNYLRVLMHPVCLGCILVNAAATGVIFAYATGSSLYFINAAGLTPDQFGMIFGASAVAVLAGAYLDGWFSARGAEPGYSLTIGLGLLTAAAMVLLVTTLAGWTPLPLVIFLMIVVALGFGLIAPNAMGAAMQQLPEIGGSVSAMAGLVQMMVAAGSSALVALLFDGHSALSMAAVMALFSALAVASYVLVSAPTATAARIAARPSSTAHSGHGQAPAA